VPGQPSVAPAASTAFMVVIVIAAISLTLRRDGPVEALGYVAFLATFLLGGALVAAILNVACVLRNRRIVRARTDTVAITSVRYTSLSLAMDQLEVAERQSIADLPYFLCLTIDSRGMEVWGGFIAPKRYCRFPWAQVENLEYRTIDLDHFRGISAQIRTVSGELVELPFILSGAGLLGLFTYSQQRITSLLAAMASLRGDAQPPAPTPGRAPAP
jgi:hypothetical protein